jgi:hypothetical protein
MPLRRITEIIPKAKAYFSVAHVLPLLTEGRRFHGRR